jgi:fatty acid desaturase
MTNISLPNITSYLTDDPVNFGRMFIDPWIILFGSFFWGALILVFGAVIYLKTERAEPMVAWFIVSAAIGYMLFPADLLFMLGIVSGFAVGFLLFKLFFGSKK